MSEYASGSGPHEQPRLSAEEANLREAWRDDERLGHDGHPLREGEGALFCTGVRGRFITARPDFNEQIVWTYAAPVGASEYDGRDWTDQSVPRQHLMREDHYLNPDGFADNAGFYGLAVLDAEQREARPPR